MTEPTTTRDMHAVDPWRLATAVAAGGAAAGLLLALLTDLLARSSIAGDGWSLQGNGALIVPFVGLPAVFGGGWAALRQWAADRRHWRRRGVVTGVLLLAVGVGLTVGLLVLRLPPELGAALLLLVPAAPLPLAVAAVVSGGRRVLPACVALPVGAVVGYLLWAVLLGIG